MTENQTVPAVLANDESPIPTDADWSILEVPGVEELARLAAGKVASTYGSVTTADDLYQDAVIVLATNAARVREYLTDAFTGERYTFRWLRDRLINGLETDARRAGLRAPMLVEPADDDDADDGDE